jgi:hypothetical protein
MSGFSRNCGQFDVLLIVVDSGGGGGPAARRAIDDGNKASLESA